MHTHIHILMHTHIHMSMHTHACVHTHMCTHACIHTHTCRQFLLVSVSLPQMYSAISTTLSHRTSYNPTQTRDKGLFDPQQVCLEESLRQATARCAVELTALNRAPSVLADTGQELGSRCFAELGPAWSCPDSPWTPYCGFFFHLCLFLIFPSSILI